MTAKVVAATVPQAAMRQPSLAIYTQQMENLFMSGRRADKLPPRKTDGTN